MVLSSGNRTGPLGIGPRTGRGMGFCAGFALPALINPGCGTSYGRRFGLGRGFCRMFPLMLAPAGLPVYGGNMTGRAEKDYLTKQAEVLEQQLQRVKERLQELDEEPEA